MKLLKLKYKNSLSRIFLAVYCISLIGGILHYHHFDFSLIEKIEQGKKLITNDFQSVRGNTYECIIQQNLKNLQTALVIYFNENQFITEEKIFFENSKFPFLVKQVHLTDNPLRAPPILS